MKLDFERAVLNRVPEMEAHPERYFCQVLFLCNEYQHFATVASRIDSTVTLPQPTPRVCFGGLGSPTQTR